MSWKETLLGDIIDFYDNKRIPLNSSQREQFQGEYRYYGAQGVIDYVKGYIFDGSYLLVAEDGENLRSRNQPIAFEVDGKFWVNNHAHIIKGKVSIADDKFIQSLLNTISIDAYITGAAQPKLSQVNMKAIKVRVPSFLYQQKIARILSAYDDLIENNLKRIKLLEEMAQLTYEEWFVRLKFPGYEQAVIDPETGLPEGWVEEALLKICDVNKNSISKRTAPENIRYIDIASAYTGGYDNPQKFIFSKAPSRARRQVKYGDTIFSTVRPNRKTYSLMLEDDPTLIASTGFAVLTPKTINTYPFIYLTVTHQSFIDKTVAVAGGAAYPAVNQSDFEQIKVTIPCESVIKSFSNLNIHKFTVIGNLKVQNQHLKEARDILLPRLMTGMIDVESLELPEAVANKTTSTASENNREASIHEQ